MKTVLVTGGGGSIGSELCRQLSKQNKVIILDNSEIALYNILEELQSENVIGRLCDIRDVDALNKLFEEYKPETVFHAAALKHVQLLEENSDEAFKTNIVGTSNVTWACIDNNVKVMVNISSDKAVNPTTVLGETKQQAEILCKIRNRINKTKFVSVRFGNVANSSGSVIPKFKKQIESGGPVTVTHKDATRYFMTIQEACYLVLEVSKNPIYDIYVLDMGEPYKILDIALQQIAISGKDVQIIFTGLRKNEKLHEELHTKDEILVETNMPKILGIK